MIRELSEMQREVLDLARPWPEQRPLPDRLPIDEPPHLPPNMCPEPLRDFLVDEAKALSVPLEMVAFPATISLGALVGRQACVQVKAYDPRYLVYTNNYGAIVSPAGTNKSAALTRGLAPAKAAMEQARQRYQEEQPDLNLQVDVLKERIDAAKQDLRRTRQTCADDQLADKIARQHALEAELEALQQAAPRLFVHDATPEALLQLASWHRRGLLLVNDELSGVFVRQTRAGREDETAVLLSAWNGDGSHSQDRITRESVAVDGLCISAVGTIQPSVLHEAIRAISRSGRPSDGLLERFQIVSTGSCSGMQWTDTPQNCDALDRAVRVACRLERLPAAVFEGAARNEDDAPAVFRFAPDAQQLVGEWMHENMLASERLGQQNSPFAAVVGKQRKLFAGLAFLFHLINVVSEEVAAGPVSLDATKLAADWVDLLFLHQKKLYVTAAADGRLKGARRILSEVRKGRLGRVVGLRDLYRRGWSCLASVAEVEDAVSLLAEYGMAQTVENRRDGPGAPMRYVVFAPQIGDVS